ncbi:hypothetical protein N7505_007317 [Penicillium chrysogenum]|uniref:Uncharacterized protein n=1 Tax=Penicillium chrysogenum TaxID=5076 RepID=A0ABQ8WDZ9_PENCH|nr:hypothetical protein N7505_007317 [Penicillium chrysogenum]
MTLALPILLPQGPKVSTERKQMIMPRSLHRRVSKQRYTGQPWIVDGQLHGSKRAVPIITIEPVEQSGEQLTSVMDVFDSSAKRNSAFRQPTPSATL